MSQLTPHRAPSPGPVSGEFFSLTQGVSQMPHQLRRPGEAEEQVNCWSSTVEGLRKRQPSELLTWFSNAEVGDMFVGRFVAAEDERYAMLILPDTKVPGRQFLGMLNLRDMSMAKITVHGTGLSAASTFDSPDGGANWVAGTDTSYLAATKNINGFSLINSRNTGLLANRTATVEMKPDLSPARPPWSFIFVQGIAYEVTYTVTINGAVVGTYTTPKASDNNNKLSQSVVASTLAVAIDGIAGITATAKQYMVWIKPDNGVQLQVKVDDDRANTLARAINDEVVSTQELPTVCVAGAVVKSNNEPGTAIDDRWFKFRTFDGSTDTLAEGTWEETVKPGIPYQLDPATMPLVLQWSSPGHFFLGPADGTTATYQTDDYEFPKWGDRTAGDEELVADPPFVGRSIRDHLLFRGRYMVCSGNRVGLSEVDDIFNFFLDSTVQVQDTDPIDLLANAALSTELEWLLAVDDNVLVFSAEVQFAVRSSGDADVLSSKTAMIVPISTVTINAAIRPYVSGASILFGSNEFGYTNVREMQAFDSTSRRMGLNLGGSLNTNRTTPKYIKGTAIQWGVGENQDFAAMMTDDDPKTLYIYKYLWGIDGTSVKRLQQAWSKWTFSTDIRNMMFDENYLYLFTSHPGDKSLVLRLATEELRLERDPNVYLDRRVNYPSTAVSATYDPLEDVTTFTLPYEAQSVTRVVNDYEDESSPGVLLGTGEKGSRQIRCEDTLGDHRNKHVLLGEEYQMQFVFSTPYNMKADPERGVRVGNTEGRLQIITWELMHRETGFYRVRVQRPQRSDSVSVFRSRVLGVSGNKLTFETDIASDGKFRVPIYCRNTEATISVESDNWLPVVIVSARWEGLQSVRTRGR